MLRVKRAVEITRAPFFTAVVVSVLVGAVVAWSDGFFHGGYLMLALLGIVCINAGLNMSNDYFDHLSGNDERNRELTPFSGGSRVIQKGILAAEQVLRISTLFYLAGIAIGIYLVIARGLGLLWIGVLGVFIAFFHNAPPVNLYSLAPGVGELAAGLGCGPLIALGSYYVQAQQFSWAALWASIPMGLLVSAILYINEFPDHDADRAVGKRTLVVALGRERAVWGYVILLVATFVTIVVGTVWGPFPYPVLVALLPLPLAWRAIRGAQRHFGDTQALLSTNALTIQLHLITGLLMCVGYFISTFF
jgi:1,4-dihydroxy-2-naphthoate octaprenyltransferase